MTTSAGLGFTLLEARQTQPHIPVNEALINLDRAAAGRVPLDMAGLATKTLTGAECSYWMLNPYGTPTGNFDLIVNGNIKPYLIINDTSYQCNFKSASGAAVAIPAGNTVICYFDGANMHAITQTDSGWQDQTMLNSWANTGGSWASLSARKRNGEIHLRGQVGHASATTGSIIATLPTGYRPAVDKQIGLIDSTGTMRRVEVQADGDIVYQGSATAITRLSFDGVVLL
jgi:hypothetical protein